MRLMLRFTIPVEKGNETMLDGSMSTALKTLVEQLQPESAYFHLQDGQRAGTIFFEASNPEQMAAINEPLFAALNASIDIQPAISLEELLEKI